MPEQRGSMSSAAPDSRAAPSAAAAREAARAAGVESICRRALAGSPPSPADLEILLSIRSREAAEPLFTTARELRARHFGDAVFMYGFVYFSTYCRNRCTFCLYREGNVASPRYRKSLDEVVGICRGLAESGVNLLDLTMGEDPLTHESGDFGPLHELIAAVRGETGLPIMISPGVVPADALGAMRAAGADFYACYQETHARDLYGRLRVGQDFEARAAARRAARRAGMLVEDGLLTGVGDTPADRARSIAAMRAEGCDQARIMSFVPQEGTPLADRPEPPRLDELLGIAALRLALPDRLIPASLDVDGLAGLPSRLDAGANVVTSIVPPGIGLCGVSNAELDVDEGRRTVAAVREELAAMGLRQGTREEYAAWMQAARTARAEGAA